jgi:hypothetical protein
MVRGMHFAWPVAARGVEGFGVDFFGKLFDRGGDPHYLAGLLAVYLGDRWLLRGGVDGIGALSSVSSPRGRCVVDRCVGLAS